jgi:signal transduction histidine kinase
VVDILVSDNGQGIPADKADEVFKPFQRLHRFDQVPGSGLGLSICQRSVAAMGGEIRIDHNYVGPGVQFVITLQLANAT